MSWENILKVERIGSKKNQRQVLKDISEELAGEPVISKHEIIRRFWEYFGPDSENSRYAPSVSRLSQYLGLIFKHRHPEYIYSEGRKEWRLR